VTIEATGPSDKIEAMLKMLEPFSIKELVRSGTIAIARGRRSASEHLTRRIDLAV
jgi:acetolactate synthase-1/3 small subunit